MRGAARRHVEIGRERGHGVGEAGEAVFVAVLRTGLPQFLDRAAHLVAAGKSVNAGAVLGEAAEQDGEILDLFGDDVDDPAFLLHFAAHRHIAGAEHDRAQTLEHFRPDDDIMSRCGTPMMYGCTTSAITRADARESS